MKYIKSIAVAAGLACAAVTSQAGIVLNFGNTPNSAIQFTGGGNFDFAGGSPLVAGADSFSITGGSGSSYANTSTGLIGSISGTYNIFNISGNTASVSGSGVLTIHDGLGHDLSGSISWSTIGQSGTGNNLNINGIINLSSISYSGVNTDLKALSNVSAGIAVVSFTFIPAETLTQLAAGGLTSSFSGSISSTSPVPEPTTVIAGALLLLPFGLSTLRIIRKK